MNSQVKKFVYICAFAFAPLYAAADSQSPTETSFYKRATGQQTEFDAKEAERQTKDAKDVYFRVLNGLSSNRESKGTIDVNDMSKEWSKNAARATIKYGKPHLYRGILERVDAAGTEIKMIMSATDKTGIVVRPFHLQGVWGTDENNRNLIDTVGALEYAAQFDPGQELYMLCAEGYARELRGCLIFVESNLK